MNNAVVNTYHKQAINCVNNSDYLSAVDIYKKILNEPLNIIDKNNFLYELGNVYEKLNMYYKAIVECYVVIIQTNPTNIIILNQIGVCYSNMNELKLAIHYFKKVLKFAEIADVYCNIGVCSEKIKNYDTAEINFLKAYKLDSNNSKIKHALGNIYYIFKKYDKSIEFYTKIKDYKKDPKMLYELSFTYLAKKQFKKGFELYENRIKYNDINPQTNLISRVEIPSINYWNGTDKCNKLLIVAEQGLGDNIQYYRFIVELSYLYPDMIIHYFCKKELFHLFKTYNNIEIIDNVIINVQNETNREFPMINYDYKIYIMSLPFMLKLEKIYPNNINYINTNKVTFNKWKEIFKPLKKYKVGFVYNGLLSSFIEKYIPLIKFEILSDLNIDLICIHKKSDIENDISNLSPNLKDKIHFYDMDMEQSFVDTIHILQNIDLLITIDTYIVHLAGIMNVKTWLLLGYYSEWRWSTGDTNFWYNSVELIRMKEKNDFAEILELVKVKLVELLDKNENSDAVKITN